MYINVWLTYIHFSLQKDIFDYKDISCFSNSNIFFMINIYSDNYQAALKYLKNTEANIHHVLVIVGDFNIRDREWDLFYPFYLSHSNSLLEITDSLNLKLFSPVHQVSTWYANNSNNSNLVINHMFLYPNLVKIYNHYILSEI